MALNYNGTLCETIEQLEALMVDLSDEQKQFIRNDFNKVPNEPIQSLDPVSPRQIRIALLKNGITPEIISSALESLEEPQKSAALIEWEYATEFKRDHYLVPSVATSLGWSTEQLDSLWSYAVTL